MAPIEFVIRLAVRLIVIAVAVYFWLLREQE